MGSSETARKPKTTNKIFWGKKKQKTRFELESWRLRPRLSLD